MSVSYELMMSYPDTTTEEYCFIRITEFLLKESQFTPYSRVAKTPSTLGKKTPATPRRGQEQEKTYLGRPGFKVYCVVLSCSYGVRMLWIKWEICLDLVRSVSSGYFPRCQLCDSNPYQSAKSHSSSCVLARRNRV